VGLSLNIFPVRFGRLLRVGVVLIPEDSADDILDTFPGGGLEGFKPGPFSSSF